MSEPQILLIHHPFRRAKRGFTGLRAFERFAHGAACCGKRGRSRRRKRTQKRQARLMVGELLGLVQIGLDGPRAADPRRFRRSGRAGRVSYGAGAVSHVATAAQLNRT